jgi:hypothetical protein
MLWEPKITFILSRNGMKKPGKIRRRIPERTVPSVASAPDGIISRDYRICLEDIRTEVDMT